MCIDSKLEKSSSKGFFQQAMELMAPEGTFLFATNELTWLRYWRRHVQMARSWLMSWILAPLWPFFWIQVKDNTQNSKLFDFRYSLRVGHADQLRWKNVTHAMRFGRFGNFSNAGWGGGAVEPRRRRECTEKRRSGIEDHSVTSCFGDRSRTGLRACSRK